MKPYPKYKPSNIQWLGDIPEHWEVKKLKYIVNGKLEYGANESAELEDRSLPRYIRITDFGNDGKLKEDTFKSLSEEVALGYLLQEGDILFARSGATVGKTFQFKNYQGVACYAGYLIKASPNSNLALSDFVYYFTKSDIYENWKNSIFVQATIQNIGADKYNQLELPIPPLPEQTVIAQFLDEKTAQIDTLIAQKQRLISLLKEERIAFINEILSDESFPLKKLKYVVSLKSGSGITSDVIRTEGQYPVFGGNGLRGFYSDFTHDGEYILIGRQGALCGNINYTTGKFWASEHAIVVTILDNSDMKWLGELLRVMNLNQYSVAAAQPGLSVENIINLKIPYPSITKQIEISKSIQTTTGKIDATLVKIVQEIELLKEYRMALISEVVTGKISVI